MDAATVLARLRKQKYLDSALTATGTVAASGDSTLIAAPAAGLCLVLEKVVIQNESAVATTMILKKGSTAFARCLGQNQGDGLVLDFPTGYVLPAATALVLNLSGANSCGYTVIYHTEGA